MVDIHLSQKLGINSLNGYRETDFYGRTEGRMTPASCHKQSSRAKSQNQKGKKKFHLFQCYRYVCYICSE